uniref:Small ribosomal subunit protein uS9c n=1 Tax=Dichotomosiphon tuberosus TaxID=118263 RepID=A0A386AWZ7_9CHLO|nr:ribosomal protein S9 [Dichotomosiphon tuberosus]
MIGIGRRKSAIARVMLIAGEQNIFINNKKIDDYFQNNQNLIKIIKKPFDLFNYADTFTTFIKVNGGGFNGQAEAICLGITRILVNYKPSFRILVKKNRLLTRDSRIKERKKYGLKKARKAPQYSKR